MRKPLNDIINQKFGKLLTKEYIGSSKWLCLCDCGNFTQVKTSALTSGKTKSCGCLVKKYTIDETFFENIDTESKAYILGFICADGNIANNLSGFKIELKSEDDELLLKIMKVLKYNNTLKYYTNIVELKEKQYVLTTARLNVTNKSMVQQLIRYGITPNKSNTLKINWELIPCELIRHFIRGLWDGDGSISIYKRSDNNKYTSSINLVSSTYTINDINSILIQNFPDIKIYNYHRNKNNLNHKTMIISNKENILTVLNFLYKDANIYLERKYNKYLEFQNTIYKTQTTIEKVI